MIYISWLTVHSSSYSAIECREHDSIRISSYTMLDYNVCLLSACSYWFYSASHSPISGSVGLVKSITALKNHFDESSPRIADFPKCRFMSRKQQEDLSRRHQQGKWIDVEIKMEKAISGSFTILGLVQRIIEKLF